MTSVLYLFHTHNTGEAEHNGRAVERVDLWPLARWDFFLMAQQSLVGQNFLIIEAS